jgi:hypothetical protein
MAVHDIRGKGHGYDKSTGGKSIHPLTADGAGSCALFAVQRNLTCSQGLVTVRAHRVGNPAWLKAISREPCIGALDGALDEIRRYSMCGQRMHHADLNGAKAAPAREYKRRSRRASVALYGHSAGRFRYRRIGAATQRSAAVMAAGNRAARSRLVVEWGERVSRVRCENKSKFRHSGLARVARALRRANWRVGD